MHAWRLTDLSPQPFTPDWIHNEVPEEIYEPWLRLPVSGDQFTIRFVDSKSESLEPRRVFRRCVFTEPRSWSSARSSSRVARWGFRSSLRSSKGEFRTKWNAIPPPKLDIFSNFNQSFFFFRWNLFGKFFWRTFFMCWEPSFKFWGRRFGRFTCQELTSWWWRITWTQEEDQKCVY